MSYFVTGFLFRFACASASSPSFRLTVLPDALYVPFILAITSESRFAYVILYNHITNKSGSEEQWLLTEQHVYKTIHSQLIATQFVYIRHQKHRHQPRQSANWYLSCMDTDMKKNYDWYSTGAIYKILSLTGDDWHLSLLALINILIPPQCPRVVGESSVWVATLPPGKLVTTQK